MISHINAIVVILHRTRGYSSIALLRFDTVSIFQIWKWSIEKASDVLRHVCFTFGICYDVTICVLFSELYEYCLKENIADKNLIAKWKKQGYENLCCLRCIQARDTNFGTNCICRVPKSKLEAVSTKQTQLFVSHVYYKHYILETLICRRKSTN